MSKPYLVIGGGPAGLSAAHSLAALGEKVVLVEKEDRLGGAPILDGYFGAILAIDAKLIAFFASKAFDGCDQVSRNALRHHCILIVEMAVIRAKAIDVHRSGA